MAIAYEDIAPSIIPNTIMRKRFINGVHKQYTIEPVAGYVLHDKSSDFPAANPGGGEEALLRGYVRSEASCSASYDFTPVTVTDENGASFTAYGTREFAARLETEVPADHIFGDTDNDPEVI